MRSLPIAASYIGVPRSRDLLEWQFTQKQQIFRRFRRCNYTSSSWKERVKFSRSINVFVLGYFGLHCRLSMASVSAHAASFTWRHMYNYKVRLLFRTGKMPPQRWVYWTRANKRTLIFVYNNMISWLSISLSTSWSNQNLFHISGRKIYNRQRPRLFLLRKHNSTQKCVLIESLFFDICEFSKIPLSL